MSFLSIMCLEWLCIHMKILILSLELFLRQWWKFCDFIPKHESRITTLPKWEEYILSLCRISLNRFVSKSWKMFWHALVLRNRERDRWHLGILLTALFPWIALILDLKVGIDSWSGTYRQNNGSYSVPWKAAIWFKRSAISLKLGCVAIIYYLAA